MFLPKRLCSLSREPLVASNNQYLLVSISSCCDSFVRILDVICPTVSLPEMKTLLNVPSDKYTLIPSIFGLNKQRF